ncbi:class I SAM-dependent methyltransferase [Desulfovibrio aminophilus]|nr:class I SAM-dependent methyltransferase [Desulfovibrio aminophilus]MCM0753946.1 class I SAM-dependent methyltransferase [Desulfovibrio aminophilus]MDY0307050.1 class I SAM-dependent methyltransferase [Desulfovibrionaceae bacterium]
MVEKKPLSELLPAAEAAPVSLLDWRPAYGGILLEEMVALLRVVRVIRPSLIFEIGTYLGETTLQMAANSRAEVHTLDLPPAGHADFDPSRPDDPELDVYPEVPGRRFADYAGPSRIIQHFGDSRTFDYAPFAGRADLVFVDGCHHEEFAASDSRKALEMVASGGAVLWHDYADYAPGVMRALDALSTAVPLRHIAGTSLVLHLA